MCAQIRDDWGDDPDDQDKSTIDHFIARSRPLLGLHYRLPSVVCCRLGFKVFCEYQGQLYLDIPFDNGPLILSVAILWIYRVSFVVSDAYLHTKQHRIFKVNNHTGVLLVDMRAARTFHNNLGTC